ncbi:uncharacterized protein LOC110839152 [Zootermopsis nevadensis]|uniref:Uncharacterized protein n=1 Tax=Zootermopsis nevadensis TaxID=136037 RepID=A0A067QJ06_ZOONE|nr:uncharacterized protein LOC110839152 [Zootermopsis nevadensis]KDR08897.1 hypothetical protein L798_00551 [Zootermopsis nevadensis]
MTQCITGVWYIGAAALLILLPSGAEQVRSYGESCISDDECVGHHMLCIANETESHCYCNRSYSWYEELKQCVRTENASVVLATFHDHQDIIKLNSHSEHKMFIKISVVGLIAVLSICIFLLSCIAYGCCSCTRISNQKTNESAASCPATCPLHNMPLVQQQDKPVADTGKAQWQDMHCPITVLDDIDIC